MVPAAHISLLMRQASKEDEVRTIRTKSQYITNVMVMQPAIVHRILDILVRRLLNWEFETINKAKCPKKSIMSFNNVMSESDECLTMGPFNAGSRNLA